MKLQIIFFLFLVPVIISGQKNFDQFNYSWVNLGDEGFTAGTVEYIGFKFSPSGEPFIAYRDSVNFYKASVMKFDGTNWEYVGIPGFTSWVAQDISLAFDPVDGEPCISFTDFANAGKVTVKKFNGINWIDIGNEGFSDGYAVNTCLEFNPEDMKPYVAYIDLDHEQKPAVKKLDGNNWINVGTAGFSIGTTAFLNLAFSETNEPYVAFVDHACSSKVTVMKYTGTEWINVGLPGFSPSPSGEISFAFDPADGKPCVAYANIVNNSGKLSMMKFNGSTWQFEGNENFSGGLSLSPSLAFSPYDGSPYVAFSEITNKNSQKATVMRYDGSTWGYVGINGFSSGESSWNKLAFSSNGQPYVAFEDYGNEKKATVIYFDAPADVIKKELLKCSVFPNPTEKFLTINLTRTPGYKSAIEIIDVCGKLLFGTTIQNNNITIDLSEYPSGIYFIRITNNDLENCYRFCKS